MAIQARGYLRQVLADDEAVLLITRPHWLVLLGKTLLWIVLTAVCVFGAIWLYTTGSTYWLWGLASALIPLAFWTWEHLVWANRMNVLTSRRILQMEGVLNKQVADSLLEKLNDVKTEQSFIGRIFGYGDIEILTASEQGANSLHMINDPLGFKRAMLNAKERFQDEHPGAH
ncbi:PH domain-containing protein [Brevundimonas sp.]|uniref:PH domain-containing protein n=1 Tax=Brevundimonas sp. TaxID=1871086 RepID=UPI0025DA8A59|nr:PH domain-containing protein [Brevundimonas sp.]